MDIKKIFRRYKKTWYGNDIIMFLQSLHSKDPFCRKLKIYNNGSIYFKKKEILGVGNELIVGKSTLLNRVILVIHGSNNRISIGENCKIGKNCRLYLLGNNMQLTIGDETTFSHDDEILVQEDGRKIVIGKDCMFSHHINIRTSDAHPIYALGNGKKRINQGKDVVIGNHVWVTPHCIIQKGVIIHDGAIIASNSIVTHDVPSHSVVAGMPASVVKEEIDWGRIFVK